jgi:hypothetical protein
MLRLLKRAAAFFSKKNEKSSFWLFTISEFIIVLLGILLALQIDNWNEARKEKKLENKYLIDIKEDIYRDGLGIDENITELKRIQQSLEITNQFLAGKIEYADTLNIHFSWAIVGVKFDYNNSTFESLKDAGINIISNNIVRDGITQLYSGRYNYILHVQDIYKDYLIGIIIPEYVKHFQIIEPLKIARPIEVPPTNNSNELRSLLNHMTLYLQVKRNQFEETRKSINHIVAMIEKELR